MTDAQAVALAKIPGHKTYEWPNGAIRWTGTDGKVWLIMPDGIVAKWKPE